jgi:hypothetical protein
VPAKGARSASFTSPVHAITALEKDTEMSIDLSWDVLPAGVYDAVVDELEFRFGANISIVITYGTTHKGQEYHVEEWLTLEAPKTSSSYQRTAEGKGRIKQILSAYDEKMPDKIEPAQLVAALEGKAVRIAVTHKKKNELPVPNVSRILGKPEAPPTFAKV